MDLSTVSSPKKARLSLKEFTARRKLQREKEIANGTAKVTHAGILNATPGILENSLLQLAKSKFT